MSDSAGMSQLKNNVQERLMAILNRGKNMQAAGARIFPLYQSLQTKRFQTENSSEGETWKPLTPKYAQYKIKRYGGGEKRGGKGSWKSWPGQGRKTLIGTSTLAGAVIGNGAPFEGTDKNVQIYKPYSLQISVNMSGVNAEGKNFDYAGYVAKERPFMQFSDASIQLMKAEMKKFLAGK